MTSTFLQNLGNRPFQDPGQAFLGADKQRKTTEAMAEVVKNQLGTKWATLAGLDPAGAVNVAKALGIPTNSKDRLKNAMGIISMGSKLLASGAAPPAEIGALILEQAQQLDSQGIDTSLMQELGQDLMSGDPAKIQAQTEALATLESMMTGQKGLDKNALAIQKETRTRIGQQLKKVSSDAETITANFNKIKGLTKEVAKGNRTATTQALVALVKLGDPTSVVKLEEMTGALNTQSPLAAVSDLLRGRGIAEDVVNAVTASLDPLNPSVMRVGDLLNTANELVLANAPGVQESFAIAKENAETLSERGRGSLFTKRLTSRVRALSELVPKTPSTIAGAGDVESRGAALRSQGLSDDQIVDKLLEEGF